MTSMRKLIVEVIEARNLLPKDGHGTSSPYVVIHFNGQRKRTKTEVRDLNPAWNEVLAFNIEGDAPSNIFGDLLEIDVFHDKDHGPTRRDNFLGRLRLSARQFVKKGEEALIYFQLEKKSLFSWVQGELGLKIYYLDEVLPPPSTTSEEGKISDVPAAPALAPVPSAQKPENQTTSAQPPAAVGEKAEATLPPTEASAAELEKSQEPPAPSTSTSEGDNQAESEKKQHPGKDQPEEAAAANNSTLYPQPGTMASTISRSVSETNLSGAIKGPRPLTRTSTVSSFTSDLSEASSHIERSTFDLVEKMHYLFIRVVKARGLPTFNTPVVKIAISGDTQVISKPAYKTTALFQWDQTFAIGRDSPESSSILEISVWDDPGHNFIGGICFDVTEVPVRDPPDSPLAPQWYRLEGGGLNCGDLMLATWIGTQADESFPEAWKTDTAGKINSRAKVYLSPKLWYLRLTVIEAQDLTPLAIMKESPFQIKAQLGFQMMRTKIVSSRNGSPSWNEDLLFVAAEPFTDHLNIFLECRLPKSGAAVLGLLRIPLTAVERRVDDRSVASRWFGFEDPNMEKGAPCPGGYKGRINIRVFFDGGYHVMDEATNACSDFRPTARQLWKPPIGTVELGIVGCKSLLPMKTINGKGTTDAYAVAKYGPKWIRTRTVSDSLNPKWNEQYTWKVYDPCTVLTIGVFSSSNLMEIDGSNEATCQDLRIGKIRIRVSTLETGKVYRNTYSLLSLSSTGMKKMGEMEVAVRFVRATPSLDFLHVYSQPLLPLMHHLKPLGMVQQEMLRHVAAKIVAAHLSRSEPPLKQEVVLHMLDADSHAFSMRKVRANWMRIVNVISGVIEAVRWVENVRAWRNPTATILVHALVVVLIWFPELIIPSLALYVFSVGAWNYRLRSRVRLPHVDLRLSQADVADREELDEEFDSVPSCKSNEVVRARYEKLRAMGTRVQIALGDLATQGERVKALVTWQDPRATCIFVVLCFVVAFVLYVVPSKLVAMAFGFYYLRHPLFRDRKPSPALNFFRRLPSLSDRVI
uniref:C2 domain-containing protein n=1 Tax=Kalanchoe fedtschenkoi TaxID=63787 RepID=A0A7N0V2L9_KALFE